MPGMLSEAQGVPPQGAPTPSSGPGPQTPPTESPGAGNPPLDGASGPGQPAADPQAQPPEQMNPGGFEELRDKAVQRMYGDNFDQLINMFETNGAAKFPRSMAVAVNGAIDYLEQDGGKLPPEVAAEVGMDLMMKLLEDIIGEKVVPDVTLEQVQQAFPAILVMYADSHPEVSKQDIQALAQEVQRQGAAQEAGSGPAATPDPNAALSTGPGPEPSGSPVPPGVTV